MQGMFMISWKEKHHVVFMEWHQKEFLKKVWSMTRDEEMAPGVSHELCINMPLMTFNEDDMFLSGPETTEIYFQKKLRIQTALNNKIIAYNQTTSSILRD